MLHYCGKTHPFQLHVLCDKNYLDLVTRDGSFHIMWFDDEQVPLSISNVLGMDNAQRNMEMDKREENILWWYIVWIIWIWLWQ